MSNIEISKINIDETQLLIKDAQNRQDLTSLSTEVQSISTDLNNLFTSISTDLTSLSTEVQSISTDLNSLSASISTNYLPLSGGTLTGRLNINLSDTFINLIANNVDATTTPDSNKYENIIFSDKNNLRLSGIETTYRTNEKIDIKLLAYNQISGGSNYFIIGRTAEGEDTYSVASPANFCNAINAVNKSGDTMTGELEIQEDGIHLKKSGADISASSISNNQYTVISMTDVNDRCIGYIQGVNYTNGKTSMQLGARKYINNANVDNILKIEVDASGTKTVSVSDSKIWRNALGASDGVWPISLGGTDATAITGSAGAVHNLFPNNLGTSIDYLTGMTQNWASTGYTKLPLSVELGGTGGTDSGWQSVTSDVFSGTIYYKKIGHFGEIYGFGLKLKSALDNNNALQLATINSSYKPSKGFMMPFGSSYISGVINLTGSGVINLYKDRNVSTMTTSMSFYFNYTYII